MEEISKEKLINLNSTLSEIIRDHLIQFKNMERAGIIYSKSGKLDDEDFSIAEHGDDTEWLLDELIWTFDAISRGGAAESPEAAVLMDEILESTILDVVFKKDIKEKSRKEKYEEWKNIIEQNRKRIDRGLLLFAENFERLWD